MSRAIGISDDDLAALAHYRESGRFSPAEMTALDLAVAMTATPATVDDELRQRLREQFTPAQVTEIASAIAWENHRARLNRALDVRAVGFSDGAFCLLPEHAAT